MAYKLTSGEFNYIAYHTPDERPYSLSDTDSRAGLDYPLPVITKLNSPFNPARLNPVPRKVSPYNGINHSMPMSTKIISVINRKVTQAGYDNVIGYFVEVSDKDSVKMRYLHLSRILVRKGMPVSRGTVIALFGNSGRSSGPHLYYELTTNNNPINPLAFRAVGSADSNKLEQHMYAHARGYGRYLD